jgi:4-hydroxy-2-oxoheptanedioate aldolase
MRVNHAKAKMLAGQPAYGYSIGLGSVVAAEALSNCGIDWIMLDTQHGSWGQESIVNALIAMRTASAVPMARVARNDYTLIGRLLDEGAMGIIVPMVNTVEDAKTAADACRLPPAGKRSWGWGGAGRYGNDYPDRINAELFVAVQIESIQAVENCEAIMSVEGIDGCWAGPADLALSMGIDPRDAANHDVHARALEQVVTACRNAGKAPGLACSSPEDARNRADQGFQFLTAGGDSGFMLTGALAGIKTLGLA